MIRRFFIAFAVGFVCMFGATVSYACTTDEIDVLGDGTNCQTTKFTLTTTEIADGGTFKFYMSAKGTFYVDCGTGGTLSGTGASGKTITRSNTTGATYTCTYTGNTEAKTIRFGGIAGTAANKPYSTAGTEAASVIRFNVTPTLVASISGSLGALFPTRNSTYQPTFRSTFANCTELTEIPSGLFSGVTGAGKYMFVNTFFGCTGLEEIPAGLFSGNSGAAQYMFWSTFSNCSGLRTIPPGLFSGINGSAEALFRETFYLCRSLEEIPAGLFNNVSGAAKSLFYQTFYNCSGLTGYIPAGLFDKITTYSTSMMTNMFYGTGLDTTCSGTTVQYITGFENYWNGKVSCTEPFVTPVTLDDQSATTVSVPTTVYLKYGTEWDSDSSGTTVISSLTTNPTKTDYIFDGYWTAANGTGPQVIDANGDFISTDATLRLAKTTTTSVTLYANWVQNYTVTYSCGGGIGTPPANGAATLTKTFTPASNTCTRDGYMFVGWAVSGTTDVQMTDFTWNYTEDKTLTAQWVETKFTLTTIEITDGGTFQFYMSAKGTFYVDCGTGGTLSSSASDVSGMKITRSNTTGATYTCTYTTSGVKQIQFGGIASTGNAYDGTNDNAAAIRFNVTPTLVAGITGSLGAIFPTIGTSYPRFYQTFYNCSNLAGTIPENLFAGVTGTASNMFSQTFYGCSGLTGSIPENLFGGISGAPAQNMFNGTFSGCSGLTGSIPENLFGGISGAPAQSMFNVTFNGCSGLTGSIPENLFAGISGAPAQSMFNGTFSGCSGLTGSIPENLFSGISGTPAGTMFGGTFNECSGLTGSIPENLFSGISGAPAAYMFGTTFRRCSRLTGSIPNRLFGNLSGAPAQSMFQQTFEGCSGLTGLIPENLFGSLSGSGATSMFYMTFIGCSGLVGYVPKSIFENILSTGTAGVTDMLKNTNLYTSCPCGTQSAETGWGDTTVGGRAVCQVGLKDGEFFYNDVCTTDCQSGGTKLMLGNGSEFPILSTKVTNPALNVKFRNNSKVCFVPLESGNGGTGSLNILYGGQTYHAGTLPVEPD